MFTVTDARATTKDTYNAIHNALDKALGDDTTEFEEGVYAEFRARIEAFTQIRGNNFTDNMRSKMTRLESKINELIAPKSTSNTTPPNVSPSAAAISSINIDENATGPSLEQQETLRQEAEALEREQIEAVQKETAVNQSIDDAFLETALNQDALNVLKKAFLSLPVMDAFHESAKERALEVRNTCHHYLYDLANKHHLELTFEETELSALGVTAEPQITSWQAEVAAAEEEKIRQNVVAAQEKFQAATDGLTQEQDKAEPDEVRVEELKDAVQQAELELDVAKSALTDLEQQKQAAEEEAQRLAAEKAAIEKAATEKEAADKLAADKKVAEKQAAEQEVARKLAAEKAAADKKVARADEFKKKIMPKLVEFSDKLKDKLEDKAHKGKAVEIQHLIDKMLQPLYGEPSQENLDTFKKELEQLLLKEKDAFKATPWIWHDVIRPALMGFLGVVVTLVTAIARPFSTTVSNFANSFFEKPDSPAFKILKSESEELVQSMGNVISTPAG